MKKSKYAITHGRKFKYSKEDKKIASIKELIKFTPYYKPFTGLLVVALLLLVAICVISVFSTIFEGNLLALFTADFSVKKVIKLSAIIAILGVAHEVILWFTNFYWSFINNNTNFNLTQALMNRINKIKQSSYDSAGTGTFTTRMFGDVWTLSMFPLRIMDYLTDALANIGFITYVFTLNPYVGLYILVYVLSIVGLSYYRIDTRQRNVRIMRKINEKSHSLQSENIRGMKDVRGINAGNLITEQSMALSRQSAEYAYTSDLKLNFLGRTTNFIKYALNFGLIILNVYLLTHGNIELAGFLIAYTYRGRINNFANFIVGIKDYVSDSSLAAQRLNEILDENKYPIETFGTTELTNCKGLIEFKNVTFGYTDKENVLNNISFEVKPNSITSLVGLSGAGKSTIVSLIDRLYDVNDGNGEILLDGINIKDLTQNGLRNNVCSISQSPYIFNMSVAENLRLANPNATDRQLINALKKANIYDYIKTLPEKLDSKLGENGIKLSGGQKQRVAIARALLKNSKVILFDEATSALDNQNQALVKKTIKELSKSHTVVMIAHRLSTVVDSDNIIFIKEGSVHAQGTHEDLMANCPEYYKLYVEEDVNEDSDAKG